MVTIALVIDAVATYYTGRVVEYPKYTVSQPNQKQGIEQRGHSVFRVMLLCEFAYLGLAAWHKAASILADVHS